MSPTRIITDPITEQDKKYVILFQGHPQFEKLIENRLKANFSYHILSLKHLGFKSFTQLRIQLAYTQLNQLDHCQIEQNGLHQIN